MRHGIAGDAPASTCSASMGRTGASAVTEALEARPGSRCSGSDLRKCACLAVK